jgi:hypothetical protein
MKGEHRNGSVLEVRWSEKRRFSAQNVPNSAVASGLEADFSHEAFYCIVLAIF